VLKPENKARIKTITVYTVIILTLLIVGLIAFDVKDDFEKEVSYSSYTAKDNGSKVLYLLSDKMGFSVRRYIRSARFLPDNATMVVFAPDGERFNDALERKYLIKWLEKGNSMVFIESSISYLEGLVQETPEQFGEYGANLLFKVGKGKIIFLEEYEYYTNEGIRNLDPGVLFIDALNEAAHKKVLFNEFYHGLGSESASLWDILNPVGRLILVQILLWALVLMFMKSRRFGKPAIVYQIIKRKENENLFALSNLYMKAKAGSLALETYIDGFKKEVAKFLGLDDDSDINEIAIAAKTDNVLKGMDLEGVMRDCSIYIEEGNNDSKKLIGLFGRLEKIRKGIKQ
jgi:hypothetical protein